MDARGAHLKVLLISLLLSGCAALAPVQPGAPAWRQADPPGYRPGNRVELLVDGPQAYEAMFQAIAGARDHVHLAIYMVCSDRVGQRLARLLARKRREGVAVRMIYDSLGSRCAEPAFLRRLGEAGVELTAHHPPRGDGWVDLGRSNHRDHRKLLIIDGRTAFTGGINFSNAYRASSFSSLRQREIDEGWRDTHIRLQGPAVADLQRVFLASWRRRHPLPAMPGAEFFPPLAAKGSARVRVVGGDGDGREPQLHRSYLEAIAGARQRVWITQGYFAPDPQLLDALQSAARRGVDVRVLLPGFTDVPLVNYAGRARYDALLSTGVKLYERYDALLHAKTAVIDGVWSTVGSANLDHRSFLHNDELNALILDPGFARRMEALFRADLAHARPIDPARWARRPWLDRLRERLSLLLDYWY